jgi:hypothetical protein
MKNDFVKYLFSVNDFWTLYNIGEVNKNNSSEKRGVSWLHILNTLDVKYNETHNEIYYDYKKEYIGYLRKTSIIIILLFIFFCIIIFINNLESI